MKYYQYTTASFRSFLRKLKSVQFSRCCLRCKLWFATTTVPWNRDSQDCIKRPSVCSFVPVYKLISNNPSAQNVTLLPKQHLHPHPSLPPSLPHPPLPHLTHPLPRLLALHPPTAPRPLIFRLRTHQTRLHIRHAQQMPPPPRREHDDQRVARRSTSAGRVGEHSAARAESRNRGESRRVFSGGGGRGEIDWGDVTYLQTFSLGVDL